MCQLVCMGMPVGVFREELVCRRAQQRVLVRHVPIIPHKAVACCLQGILKPALRSLQCVVMRMKTSLLCVMHACKLLLSEGCSCRMHRKPQPTCNVMGAERAGHLDSKCSLRAVAVGRKLSVSRSC